jgi:hypothetical protein
MKVTDAPFVLASPPPLPDSLPAALTLFVSQCCWFLSCGYCNNKIKEEAMVIRKYYHDENNLTWQENKGIQLTIFGSFCFLFVFLLGIIIIFIVFVCLFVLFPTEGITLMYT